MVATLIGCFFLKGDFLLANSRIANLLKVNSIDKPNKEADIITRRNFAQGDPR